MKCRRRRIKLIFDKVETAIFVMDIHGKVQSWNPAFATILGVTNTTTAP